MSDPSTKPPTGKEAPTSQKKRVMVVDDELTLAELLAEMMIELGYECESFSDPTAALAAFSVEGARYDIVICDQTMPELSGLELIERMRALKPGFNAILCSGFTRRVTERDASIDPSIRFLNKPYTFEMLQTVLGDL